jgi:hypothetical protein
MIDFSAIINAIKNNIGFDFNISDWDAEEKIEKDFKKKYGYLFKVKMDEYHYVDGEEGDTGYTECVAFINGQDVITYQSVNKGGDDYEVNVNMHALLQQEPNMVTDLIQRMLACAEPKNDIQFYPAQKIKAIVVDGQLAYDYNNMVIIVKTEDDLSKYGYFYILGKAAVLLDEYKTEYGYKIPFDHNMQTNSVRESWSSEDAFWGDRPRTIAMIKKEVE